MKRFLADAALICLLVMLGSFMKDQQSADIGNQIEVFEKQVNMERNWEDTIMRCDSDSGKKLIKSMVLRTADRQGMC